MFSSSKTDDKKDEKGGEAGGIKGKLAGMFSSSKTDDKKDEADDNKGGGEAGGGFKGKLAGMFSSSKTDDKKDEADDKAGGGFKGKLAGMFSSNKAAAGKAAAAGPSSSKGNKKKLPGMFSSLAGMAGMEGDEHGGDGNERMGVTESLIWVVRFVVRVVMTYIESMPLLWNVLWAAVCIGIFAILVLLVLYLIYRANPRAPRMSRTMPLEGYLETVYEDFMADMRFLHGARNTPDCEWLSLHDDGDVRDSAAAMLDALETIMNKRAGTLEADLRMYVEFGEPLRTWDMSSRSDIRNNSPDLVNSSGDLDTGQYRDEFMDPMDAFLQGADDLSNALSNQGDDLRWGSAFPGGWTAGRARVVTAVHECRLLRSQLSGITRMLMTRRKFMPMGLWTLYYAPFVVNVFTKRIPSIWLKVPNTFMEFMRDGVTWWGNVGTSIMLLPCKVAFSDPVERQKRCKSAADGFVSGFNTDTVVEEGFGLGGIVSALKSVGTFFINMASVGIAIGELFVKFPVDPFGTIIGFVVILIGIIVGVFLMVWYLVITCFGIFFALLGLFGTLWVFGRAILLTWYLAVLCVLVALPYFGLWLIDLPTKGLVLRMMRCENEPNSWYRRNAFADGNQFSRVVPICLSPCFSRYRPSMTGCCCDRLPNYMPDRCPQQQVYGIYRSKGVESSDRGPYVFVKYRPDRGFGSKQVAQKRDIIIGAFQNKVSWYQRCYAALNDYDYLNRHLCANVDLLGLDPDAVLQLATVCKECYCDYEPANLKTGLAAWMTPDGHQADNKRTCDNLAPLAGDGVDAGTPPGQLMLRRLLLVSLLVLLVWVVLYGMILNGNKLLG